MNQLIPTMPTFPTSSMQKEQGEIFEKLEDGPILFTRRGSAAGVLVHPSLWNKLLELLEDMEDAAVAQERLAESDAFMPLAEAEAELRRLGVLDES